MDRVKRISNELLERYQDKFGIDMDENKKTMKEIAIVRSKLLRNKVAGYITSDLRRQAAEKERAVPSEGEGEENESQITEEEE
jgi:small subunit ribosomal protein S17e